MDKEDMKTKVIEEAIDELNGNAYSDDSLNQVVKLEDVLSVLKLSIEKSHEIGKELGYEEYYEEFESRTCGSCRVMNCTILNALADTGKFRLVDFGCNLWKVKDKV